MATLALMRHGVMLATLVVLQVKASGVVLELLKVESDLEYRYAVTHVTAVFANRRNSSQEIPLKLTLPKNAYVSSLVIEVGGKNHTTVVTEKQRNGRKGPTIPHQREANKKRKRNDTKQKFRATAKARGLQTVIFYLSYEELLLRRRGSYTHTLHLGIAKRLEVVEVSVRILETEPIEDLQTLRVPWTALEGDLAITSQVKKEINGPGDVTVTFRGENVTISNKHHIDSDDDDDDDVDDDDVDEDDGIFSISYDIDRQADGGEIQIVGQFFVHRFSPEGLPKLPTHTVFVLDVSGSMHDNGKLKQLKTAMRSILTNLPPEDSFEVLVFSTQVTSLGRFQAVPHDIERSLSRIQRLHALGGTNFNDALLKALHDINSFNLTSGAKQVVFLTDGRPSLGERKPNQLRRNIREANIHHLPIFSLGFGQDADMRLLRQVSSDNRGFTRKIDEDVRPADQLKSFYDEISSPLMTDVDVLYLPDEVDPNSVVRQGPSTFYAGDEMVLAGQLRDGVTEVQPIVTGKGYEGPVQFRVSRISTSETPERRDNYVERLWAYLTVKDLLDMQEVVQDKNLRAEMNFRALEIAIKFQFVTKLTSLKPEEEEEEEEDILSGDQSQGQKSASRHQKSNTGTVNLFYDHLALLSEAEFAKTLPAPLSTRLNTASNNVVSFGDNDPHFVVQVSGMEMPLCFDIHGGHGQVLSLVRDHNSGIVVNGLVTSALDRPEATYFTELFIGLGMVNFTITPHNITITARKGHRNSKAGRVSRSVWPFGNMYRRGRGRGGKPRPHSKSQHSRQRREVKAHWLSAHGSNHLGSPDLSRHHEQHPLKRQNIDSTHHHNGNDLKREQFIPPTQDRNHPRNYSPKQCENCSRKGVNIRNHFEATNIPLTIGREVQRFTDNLRDNPLKIGKHNLFQNKEANREVAISPFDRMTLLNEPRNKSKLKRRRQSRKAKGRKHVKRRFKRNSIWRKIRQFIHPQATEMKQNPKHIRTHRAREHVHNADHPSQRNQSQRHPLQRHPSQRHPSHGYRHHRKDPHPHANSRGHGRTDDKRHPIHPISSTYHLQSPKININQDLLNVLSNADRTETSTTHGYPVDGSLHGNMKTQTSANSSKVHATRTVPSTTLLRNRFEATEGQSHSLASGKRIIHPQANRNVPRQLPGSEIDSTMVRFPSNSHHSRNQTRPSRKPILLPVLQDIQNGGSPQPSHQAVDIRGASGVFHPQSKVFLQTATGQVPNGASLVKVQTESDTLNSIVSQQHREKDPPTRSHNGRRPTASEPPGKERRRNPRRKSEKTFSWRRAAGRRYGDVVVALRNRKKLELLIGDVEAHFVITRSKTKYGQEFLGFYVEEHKMLSPNTTGIIGQFTYKTVGTLTSVESSGNNNTEVGMRLAVLHAEPDTKQYRVSEVSGLVSSRRSMLHKNHVRCLLIPHQGRGLVAGTPEDYLLPCLTC